MVFKGITHQPLPHVLPLKTMKNVIDILFFIYKYIATPLYCIPNAHCQYIRKYIDAYSVFLMDYHTFHMFY